MRDATRRTASDEENWKLGEVVQREKVEKTESLHLQPFGQMCEVTDKLGIKGRDKGRLWRRRGRQKLAKKE